MISDKDPLLAPQPGTPESTRYLINMLRKLRSDSVSAFEWSQFETSYGASIQPALDARANAKLRWYDDFNDLDDLELSSVSSSTSDTIADTSSERTPAPLMTSQQARARLDAFNASLRASMSTIDEVTHGSL